MYRKEVNVQSPLRVLETSINARLFHRNADGLLPTAAARPLVERSLVAEREFLGVMRVARHSSEASAGRVRMAAPPVVAHVLLPAFVAEFADQRPGISLDVLVSPSLGLVIVRMGKTQEDKRGAVVDGLADIVALYR